MILRHGIWWDRFWGMIPKVLPTVYDDSLSYYEVLNKLIKATGELAGAIDDVLDDAAQYTEDAEQAATSAAQSAQASQASAEEAAESASIVGPPVKVIPVGYPQVTRRTGSSQVYKVGKMCVGAIGLEFIAGPAIESVPIAAGLPLPKNVDTETWYAIGYQTNDVSSSLGQTIFAKIERMTDQDPLTTPERGKLVLISPSSVPREAETIFTFSYVIE